ncbi:glycerophosphodiester phosphodiesterase family protein [Polaribacter cellanae]|uniref:Glycerophosphodiester phosphodiesterase family protein n=1 Tax=Polaribacter cellanae TaxID=2818493 RepID=A0A975CNN8_9FLAO|nr:glycerophosphodiester phosphodiesterase family protein [Polaribacter cellanae]QTE22555.1 glycerophosphodiester phosphodiesterase family protein [Polaribacter cellanae]
MKKTHLLYSFLFLLSLMSCKETTSKEEPKIITKKVVTINNLIKNLKDSKNEDVIVVAHRGDWRNAPENSIQAIKNCIKMGVDMVEIDVQETKDGQLVLMHDKTINRTTTGKGKVTELTWEYLQTLQLLDGIGHETPHKIPTLQEALKVCKGKILVNLDKSYKIFDKCFEIAKKTGTLAQIIIKGNKTKAEVESEFGNYLNNINFMPIVRLNNPNSKKIVTDYLKDKNNIPVAFEFTVPQDTIALIKEFKNIREQGASIWVNSLWPKHNGGHDDEKAALNPKVYDWYLNNHIDIIQTDRPALLLSYLREKGKHQ